MIDNVMIFEMAVVVGSILIVCVAIISMKRMTWPLKRKSPPEEITFFKFLQDKGVQQFEKWHNGIVVKPNWRADLDRLIADPNYGLDEFVEKWRGKMPKPSWGQVSKRHRKKLSVTVGGNSVDIGTVMTWSANSTVDVKVGPAETARVAWTDQGWTIAQIDRDKDGLNTITISLPSNARPAIARIELDGTVVVELNNGIPLWPGQEYWFQQVSTNPISILPPKYVEDEQDADPTPKHSSHHTYGPGDWVRRIYDGMLAKLNNQDGLGNWYGYARGKLSYLDLEEMTQFEPALPRKGEWWEVMHCEEHRYNRVRGPVLIECSWDDKLDRIGGGGSQVGRVGCGCVIPVNFGKGEVRLDTTNRSGYGVL